MGNAENAASVPLREIMANQERDREGAIPRRCAHASRKMTKKRRALRVATRRERPSLNLHFQHFARRQITTSLRRSSDINDIFDLRRRHRRRRSPSCSSSSSLCPPPAVFRNSQTTMDVGYLRIRAFYPLNERRTSIIGNQFASKTDIAHIELFAAINQASTCRCANHHFYFHNG